MDIQKLSVDDDDVIRRLDTWSEDARIDPVLDQLLADAVACIKQLREERSEWTRRALRLGREVDELRASNSRDAAR